MTTEGTVMTTDLDRRAVGELVPLIPRRGQPLSFRSKRLTVQMLVLTDVLVLQLCVGAALLLRHALTPVLPITLSPVNYVGVSIGVMTLPLVFYGLGLYPGFGMAPPQRLRRQIGAIALMFFALCVWDAVIQQGLWSRGILLMTWAFATFLIPLSSSILIQALIHRGIWGTPVLVAGPIHEAGAMIDNLSRHRELGFVPVGYLSNEGGEGPTSVTPIPFLSNVCEANQFSDEIKTILIVRPSLTRKNYANFIMNLAFPSIILVPSSFEGRGLWVSACDLGNTSGVQIRKNLLVPLNHRLKRIFDCTLALPLFVLSLPVIGIFALWIFIVSPGNPFYAQTREGRGGRLFPMLKLRSMILNAERRLSPTMPSNAPGGIERRSHRKPLHDPRILPMVGHLVRKTSIDELPQLWNVLKGDMSLVGPRPFPHYHLEGFTPAFRLMRHSAMPGISGLWQIESRSDSDLAMQEELDTYYIQNWSLWLDIYILTRTLSAVVSGKGAR